MSIYENSRSRRNAERQGLPWTAAVLSVLTILITAGQASGQAFHAWVSPRLVRVGQTAAPGTTTSITLSSARGETVAAQVIVQAPSGGLTNVNVTASPLTGPATIDASNITLYREYYVTGATGTGVTGTQGVPPSGSNQPQGTGIYAEPLIPFIDPQNLSPLCGNGATVQACNATVSAGQNQPYWIDFFVPRTNSPAGAYTGSISVTADQGSATIPVTLTVWKFELPLQPSEGSLWSLFAPTPVTGNINTDIKNLAQALMRNKVMYWSDVPGDAAADMAAFGLVRSGLDYYHNFSIPCDETANQQNIPSTSQINIWTGSYPAGLPLDIYVSDEWGESASCMPPNGPTAYAYQDVATTARNAHMANPYVKTAMTAYAPDSSLSGSIDHWVLLDSHESWPTLPWTGPGDLSSYASCNVGNGNTPEWMVDYPPINERVQAGFLNYMKQAVGILYYHADGWTSGNTLDSWNKLDVINPQVCNNNSRPGDGMFVYPPAPIGSTEPAPGIRLKSIRDGIQDFEYAHILHTMNQDAFVGSTLQNYTSWSSWDQNPSDLENARQSMGQKINDNTP